MAPNEFRAESSPSKRFFIEMFTRDIQLEDCILDLVDNSIHSALSGTDFDASAQLFGTDQANPVLSCNITIALSPEGFSIEDDAKGISIEEAKSEILRFGLSDETESPTPAPIPVASLPGLSVYGIGMKRAIFKIGRRITIDSRTETESWTIPIDVDQWLGRPEWPFPHAVANPEHVDISSRTGTRIRVGRLNANVAAHFALSPFRESLKRRIAKTYGLFLSAGLRISLDGEEIAANIPSISKEGDIVQAGHAYDTKDGVSISVVAGLLESKDTHVGGWYVFCNGRMVVEADRTRLTGWGEGTPQYHVKYYRFVGYVFFRSSDLYKLPWTTTKQGVVLESEVYQTALRLMRSQSRPVLDYLNDYYQVNRDEVDSEPLPEADQEVVSVTELPAEPTQFPGIRRRTRRKAGVSVQFRASQEELEKVRKSLSSPRMSATRIGRYTFDYYLDKECN